MTSQTEQQTSPGEESAPSRKRMQRQLFRARSFEGSRGAQRRTEIREQFASDQESQPRVLRLKALLEEAWSQHNGVHNLTNEVTEANLPHFYEDLPQAAYILGKEQGLGVKELRATKRLLQEVGKRASSQEVADGCRQTPAPTAV